MRNALLRSLLAALLATSFSTQSWAFAREFNQDNHPSAFHEEGSTAELCLFVHSRQGVLMIQPLCMKSVSSHTVSAITPSNDQSSLIPE